MNARVNEDLMDCANVTRARANNLQRVERRGPRWGQLEQRLEWQFHPQLVQVVLRHC